MHEPVAILTVGIIILTCLFSLNGFRDSSFESKHIFCPDYILADKQFYRLITSAFLHSGVSHLAFNMMSFYCFAEGIEIFYGKTQLFIIYFGSILGGSLLSLFVHRHHDYLAYGASGGVCGIIFAHIFLLPGGSISMFFLPIGIPSWLYAILFLGGTFYALKSRRDNIGHDAHLGGAIFGFVIVTAMHPKIISASPKLFAVVLIACMSMLFYIIKNPLFLPMAVFRSMPNSNRKRTFASYFPSVKKPAKFNADALLDKISQTGLDSLTMEERQFLESISEKYRRRAETKKPDSELIF